MRLLLRPFGACVTLIAGLLALPVRAGSDGDDARMLTASPDRPASVVGWQRAVRAKIGVNVPWVADSQTDPGFFLRTPALIELSNTPDSLDAVPSHFWRARVGLEAGYGIPLSDVWLLTFTLTPEHESDHVTARALVSPFGFLSLNDIDLGARIVGNSGRHTLLFRLAGRLHILTCTLSAEQCADGGGYDGSFTGEALSDLTYAFWFAGESPLKFKFFASAHGAWLAPARLINRERRFTWATGFAVHTATRGLFSLAFAGLTGTEVGFLRTTDITRFGVELGWSPDF